MTNASLNNTQYDNIDSARTLLISALYPLGLNETRLCCASLAGRFSLVDEAPLCIDTVPGMTLHVTSGSIHISGLHGDCTQETPAGHRFVADSCDVLMLRGRAGVELQIDWPE